MKSSQPSQVTSGDYDGWHDAWLSTAQRLEAEARASHPVSARDGRVVNDLRLYGDGPDAASTLQAEQATTVRGVERGTAATGVLGSGDRPAFRKANIRGNHLTARLDSACPRGTRSCSLQLRLDAPDGPLAAVVPVAADGGWQEQSVTLKREITGTHDLYLVAKGAARVAALDWLTIRP
ncbi:carbohydrate-binding protein [Streptomyces sp. 3214.6]|uniref:carbohydrate-binding protein n=1 Tax=Streptomyces sp. 3214.6 TaxID=1882757 RepID=UPI00090BF329|nr:carbohydrate-binding protein [Streptomyces sp. 3214.6]SHH37936.1 Carbohydrate binding module (family 6) [Streptomyces sp. 3214.6]